jgi:hypothetical protein
MLVGRCSSELSSHKLQAKQKSHGVGMTKERVVLWFISDAGTVNHRSLGFAWNWDSFDFACSLWLESSEEHLPTSIAGVPSAMLGTGSSTARH